MQRFLSSLSYLILLFIATVSSAQVKSNFEYMDVFQLEYAANPQISPNGETVVYSRTGFDLMKDKSKSSLWLVSTKNNQHYKLTNREANEKSAVWSSSGDRIAFISSTEESNEVFIYWVKTGVSTALTQLENSPSSLSWSPDGKSIAFTMKINADAPVIVDLPSKPKKAEWAKKPRITDRLKHEADGSGYIDPGFTHIFVIPADGGAPRQLTNGNFNHKGDFSWAANGEKIYFSANRNKDWEYDFRNSEIYSVAIKSGEIAQLTNRKGPDESPVVSPNGKHIAYLGFEDKVQTYQLQQLQVMDDNGDNKKLISKDLDRSISDIAWDRKSKGLYFKYKDLGLTKIGYIDLKGNLTEITDDVGGTSLGRPYSSGSFSLSDKDEIAYTFSRPDRPADVAVIDKRSKKSTVLTALNEELLGYRNLAKVEEIWYKSSVDGRDIQGFIAYPPNYDKNKKYPLLVENHGGPILNYGPHFSAEIQLFAANDYIVFFPNPRGSTSYGQEFGNLLFNNYPGEDYNDVMDGIDKLIERGEVDANELYVTGGSAGGTMTAWMIGKNNRFKAAAVIKPVVNWISKTLVADNYFNYANSRITGQPWENVEGYWGFSPLSLVENIETPTMVMVGMDDLRTPPSEAKQLYHALKLRKIESVLVEIPEASHSIAARPSNLIAKVAHILAWFEKYK
ncbi:Dipeptidyl aminopeptidase/acylaminoacyl peptidase [Salegentibacter echinorum]|uniref:Dipeptidyl aminopeptidase/acylaminoacyl peptidase n=1 Tax=Salegentibacter echinorum TaxID=1073325 RepID=A0A1M5FSL8_SALEC|nr:S9 family peptidase [Salegentibacter echinorum]SHF94466.1 Dipeptidyl aminopeptidase/acylaminoacyl peptidase [Salegentibacter echinorum]